VSFTLTQYLTQKSKALLGTFAARKKYLAAAPWHDNKRKPCSGEIKTRTKITAK